jgi:hypothetical protein
MGRRRPFVPQSEAELRHWLVSDWREAIEKEREQR